MNINKDETLHLNSEELLFREKTKSTGLIGTLETIIEHFEKRGPFIRNISTKYSEFGPKESKYIQDMVKCTYQGQIDKELRKLFFTDILRGFSFEDEIKEQPLAVLDAIRQWGFSIKCNNINDFELKIDNDHPPSHSYIYKVTGSPRFSLEILDIKTFLTFLKKFNHKSIEEAWTEAPDLPRIRRL